MAIGSDKAHQAQGVKHRSWNDMHKQGGDIDREQMSM